MLNSVKYYIFFFNILFLLNIRKQNKTNILLFLFNRNFIINHEKIEKQIT